MRRLLRLYPARWRARYGDEFGRLVDDLLADRRGRPALVFDVVRGALDARLNLGDPMDRGDAVATRRGLMVGLVVSAALSAEVVRSNVLFPSRQEDDGWTVLAAYLCVFAALLITGVIAQREAATWRGPVQAGALAGAVIGALTIGTFFVVDNVFFDTVREQQTKIDGLASSGMSSMRAYINVSLAFGGAILTVFFGATGAGLGAAGAFLADRLRPAR